MNYQLLLVALLVAAASAYLLRRAYRTVTAARCGGCGTGCTAPPKTTSVLIPTLTVRRRD